MIVERIFNGESAEQIGITPEAFASRRATLDKYLQQSAGRFETTDYLAWLQKSTEGQRAADWQPDQPSRGLGDTVVKITTAIGIKPCGGCKHRQKTLNKWLPYKTERV